MTRLLTPFGHGRMNDVTDNEKDQHRRENAALSDTALDFKFLQSWFVIFAALMITISFSEILLMRRGVLMLLHNISQGGNIIRTRESKGNQTFKVFLYFLVLF